MNLEVLTHYGIDWERGVKRCLNDRLLYGRMLKLFLADDTLARAQNAYDNEDYQALFRCMHELKGASSSADMTELSVQASLLVDALRGGLTDAERVAALMTRVETAYHRCKEGILLASREQNS